MQLIFWLLIFVISLSSQTYAIQPLITDIDLAYKLSEQTNMPVLLIFSAENCTYCQQLKEDIDKDIYKQSMDRLILCVIDIDQDPNAAKNFKVKNIPDSRIINNHNEKTKIVGYNRKKYQEWIIDGIK